ncbi:transglutaminase domain-containing protein [Tianweitania sp. BSSL-BM11]|uniref:Transglutaminase domain-containing protein n=1 Tax=Tianweitania aestuarii TaxID=2814886 RepID=A0ABS5RX73_9HYPH|nr:transglutaminase domain-containing protein [Tianweitania aestuarii]MBS9720886.1 transglutaminase domain-containing protein [Tianweitania aestuarii]
MTLVSRRKVLQFGLAVGAMAVMPRFAFAAAQPDRVYAPAASDWRAFNLSTTVTPPDTAGATSVWLPVPSVDTAWQRTLDTNWTGNAAQAEFVTDPTSGATMLHARFDAGQTDRMVVLTTRVETRNRTIDWSKKSDVREDPAVLEAALKGSSLAPIDGVVGDIAAKATAGANTDVEKVQAIYNWIVASCYRNLDTPGCGSGDLTALLANAAPGGKCADLNGLFVAMARASGVPARDVYGVRVAPSAFGYKQLGANTADVTGAQHCRAEAWLEGYGWVAMDPADVLKVMRAETKEWIRDRRDPLVAPVDAALFGNWEGNWVAFNSARDVALPGAASAASVPFLMYPQGMADASQRFDELDAKAFSYKITAAEA